MNENLNGDGLWLFALLILFGMGGGFGFGNNGRAATVEDINTTSNFARLENQVRANADLTERKADAISNGICSLGYELQGQINGVNTNMMQNTATLSAQINALAQKMDQNKIESLQAQVSELKTQNMFCGIPRINPYGYGVYPYNGCGCNCNGTGNI